MTKKSNMVKAGKAAKKKKTAERREQHDEELTKKEEVPLRVSDFVPAELYGLMLKEDPVLPTIDEIKAGTFKTTVDRSDSLLWEYLNNPTILGEASLIYIYACWYEEMKKVEKEIERLENRLAACGRKTPAGVVPSLEAAKVKKARLARTIEYVKALCLMAEKKPPLPGCHKPDRFVPGTEVLCYIPEEGFLRKEMQRKFLIGTVVDDAKAYWKIGMPVVLFDEPVSHWMHGRSYKKVQFYVSMWCILKPEEYEQLMVDEVYREQWLWMLRVNRHNNFCPWVEQLYFSFGEGQKVIDAWRAETKAE